MQTLKILIVDDDPDGAEGLADLISVFGHRSHIAHSGADAVAAFARENFDLTFMDVHMPGMNGVDACLNIHRTNPQAKLIFITGLSDEYLAQQRRRYSVMEVLRKPVDLRDILRAIEGVRS